MALAAALAVAPTSLFAEAQIQGSPEAVRIETQNTSIEEVLAALGNAFELRYRSSAKLGKQLSGIYEGSLQRVVTRMLEGYDFVLRSNKGKIEITVLGTRNAGPAVASSASNSSKAAPSPSTPAPAAAPSRATEQAPPSAPAAIPTRLAEGSVSEIAPPMPVSDLRAAVPVPTPMPGSGTGPIPELIAGAAAVPAPTPSSGPALFPEPVGRAAAVPPPGTDSSSASVPVTTPVRGD
jgi:hypothetical protein